MPYDHDPISTSSSYGSFTTSLPGERTVTSGAGAGSKIEYLGGRITAAAQDGWLQRAADGTPRYSAAVRAIDGGLRHHRYFDPNNPTGVSGEEHAIEAKGQIFVPMPRSLKPHECDALSTHQHCSDAGVRANHVHAEDERVHCLVLEKFPVSVHFAVPLRDPIIPNLGDNLIVTIERRPYVGDIPYAHEPEE